MNSDSGNLTPEILQEAISLIGPIDPDPIIGFKVNRDDLECLKQCYTFECQSPSVVCIPPLYNGLALYVDYHMPKGKCKPVRQSDLNKER